VPGSHEASISGFKALKAAGVAVHPHFTICRLNQKSAVEYPEFCKEIGSDRFSANLIIPAGRGDDAELTIRYRDIGKIVEDIRKKALEAGVKFMWYSSNSTVLV